jgi:hypothetical protein
MMLRRPGVIQGRSTLGGGAVRRDTRIMTGRPDEPRFPSDETRPIDDELVDDDGVPTPLDVPIETPIEDAIESHQSAGSLDDEFEPHA